MLNRRFAREKVTQTVFAFYQGGVDNAKDCEKLLLTGFNKTYELYYYLLSIVLAFYDYVDGRVELSNNRFTTDTDLVPHQKFIHNKAIKSLRENINLKLIIESYKFNHSEHKAFFKHLYSTILKSDYYKEYIAKPGHSFVDDRDFLCRIFHKVIAKQKYLRTACSEQSIFWACDYYNVAHWVFIGLHKSEEVINTEDTAVLDTNEDVNNDELNSDLAEFTNEELDNHDSLICKVEEDKEIFDFARNLLNKTLLHSEDYNELIANSIENWDTNRVALTELVLIKLSINELLYFPSIPVKATMNEYVDLARLFCSEKSRSFVNGVMNKLYKILKEENRIKKSGRGLI